MYIQLKDHAGKQHRIPAEGAVFGRDRNRCDVVLPDIGVSGVHAKIYRRASKWMLEDLRSSNGTFVGEDRVEGPVELAIGLSFSLFRWRFEVMEIDDTPDERSSPTGADSNKTASLLTKQPVRNPEIGMKTRTVAKPKLEAARQAAPLPEEDDDADTDAPAARRGDARGFSPANFIASAKTAIGYYLTAIPALVLRPLGYVRESIAAPRHDAMAPVELMAWAFVPMTLGVIIAILAGLVVSLTRGVFAIGQLLVAPGITLGIALVVSIIIGLVWHPVNGWLIRKLGGASDAAGRSNMFVVLCTTSPLPTIAAALGLLLGLIPFVLIGALTHLLGVAASLLVLLAVVTWYQHFGVARWFVILLVVLGAAWAALGVRDVVQVTRVGIASLRTAASETPVAETEKTAAPQEKSAEVEAAVKAAPENPTGTEVVTTVVADEAAPTGKAAAMVATTDLAPPSGEVPSVAAAASTPALTYAQFLAKREQLEKAIEADPPVLTRAKGMLDLYKRLHSESARISAKYGGRASKDGGDVVSKRLYEAELYDATVSLVVQIEQLLDAEKR